MWQSVMFVAEKGQLVSPQLLAAIASTGVAEISCYALLRVAVVSSGDEVIRPGETFHEGQVYDSNHYCIMRLVEHIDC